MRGAWKVVLVIVPVLIFNGCSSSSVTDANCYSNKFSSDIKSIITDFRNHGHKEVLRTLLSKVDSCEKHNPALLPVKAQILSLLEECNEGLAFAKSLKREELDYPYQRVWFINSFQICLDSSRLEELSRNTVDEIDTYLLENPTDEISWYNIYSLKSRYLGSEELEIEIDSLERIIDKNIIRLLRFHYSKNDNPNPS